MTRNRYMIDRWLGKGGLSTPSIIDLAQRRDQALARYKMMRDQTNN